MRLSHSSKLILTGGFFGSSLEGNPTAANLRSVQISPFKLSGRGPKSLCFFRSSGIVGAGLGFCNSFFIDSQCSSVNPNVLPAIYVG